MTETLIPILRSALTFSYGFSFLDRPAFREETLTLDPGELHERGPCPERAGTLSRHLAALRSLGVWLGHTYPGTDAFAVLTTQVSVPM